jgi:YidC/Oxa1 family membrane protein insertase
MLAVGIFEIPAGLLSWFYGLTHNYAISIALIAVVVMAVITPLTLKSTKGMLEMQRLAPELRKLQQQYRNDRTKLNEETMKLYQEHKVNPMSSCLPLLAQMPIFIIMFRVLTGLTYRPSAAATPLAHAVLYAGNEPRAEIGFVPRFISHGSELFQSLIGQQEMVSFGIDLSISPADALGEGLGKGLIYALLVVLLGVLYFLQQRMIAARAMVSPTMSASQQKLMQYLPVAFAVFQVFFLTGLVVYYMAQAVLRMAQQAYITRRFYGHEESLGRQAQRAGERARELAKEDGGGGLLAQARRDLGTGKADKGAAGKAGKSGQGGDAGGSGGAASSGSAAASKRTGGGSKRTTPPKNRPTPSGQGPSGRPAQAASRPGGSRSKGSGGKKRR